LEDEKLSIDDAFGPVRMRVNTRSVKGRVSTMPVSTFAAILKFFSWLIPARINGAYRRTPFFDTAGKPVVSVKVISLEERDRAKQSALQVQATRHAR
jgi:hypothetical protein